MKLIITLALALSIYSAERSIPRAATFYSCAIQHGKVYTQCYWALGLHRDI